MDAKKFFKEMYFNVWQSNDLSKLGDFYAKDFQETIQVADEKKEPIELNLNYDDLVRQAKWKSETYKDTTFEIKKIVASDDDHISVHFYSTSIVKETGELRHRCVCGIWHLNEEGKIDRVWAVVTPYYPT
ncbi:nuclear transport factor 2 family protein [Coxiella burnetii]|uniref:SnoaL-like domain-containing protein n=1 Tax=Coxiella burnetii (strain Dugway 5J108-111) TaxID=434922 RepID=A9KFE1_COXBN|nr:nuclear transport factor 2 family protein [Coxiella burnetii]ABS76692.1 hypothetical protein CBUD_0850 [Coxiella burnetii Dugway 5J108-111]OYK80342.1 nuclear transport factor 2 family protein [Coxiella burnetii]OYK82462.1 nuclear transport factor 2 family protein [Coxiella burnetii]